MPERSTDDLFTSSATSKFAIGKSLNKEQVSVPYTNVGRSLKIAAEPAVIEQTPTVILAKMRFLARREVGRAPFWICGGPFTQVCK